MIFLVVEGRTQRESELGSAANLSAASDVFRLFATEFEPATVSGNDAAKLLGLLCSHEKVVTGLKMLVARRVDETRIWAKEGHQSPAHFLASQSGEPVGQARKLMETASDLADLPGVEEAVRKGDLSAAQASEITGAAKADPSAEKKLLDAATSETFSGLKDLCGKTRAAAASDQLEAYRNIHRRRYLRRWTTSDGAFHIQGLLTPADGARLWARVEDETKVLFKEARRAGAADKFEAIQADALVSLVVGDAHSVPAARMILNVDAAAMNRGHVNPGETCEIRGAGNIPVEIAQDLYPEALVKFILRGGVDVTTISHHKRAISESLATAVFERDGGCVVPGCDNCRYVEIDHIEQFALGGPTEMNNLVTLCTWHHRQKTLYGWVVKRDEHRWLWLPPPDSI